MGAYCDISNEVFIASMLRDEYTVSIPKKGDFQIGGKYTLEVGGKSKKFK